MKDGKFISDSGIIEVIPKEEDLEKLKAYEGKLVYMGIRSERFLSRLEDHNSFKAKIDVIENLGKEKLLYTELEDGSECIMSVPGHFEYEMEEIHNFTFDVDALHFFDGETTLRIN